jgi:hypothetical protein
VLLAAVVLVAALRLPDGPQPVYAIDCDTYPNQKFAQLFLKVDPDDSQGLDGENDNGIACEELPCPCDLEPVEEAIGDTGGAAPTATLGSGTTASAGNVTAGANASAATATLTPAPTLQVAATAPAPATATPFPAVQSLITPPSTGGGGLR